MHLRVVIDLAMSLPDGERQLGWEVEGCCGWMGGGVPAQQREAESKENKAVGC